MTAEDVKALPIERKLQIMEIIWEDFREQTEGSQLAAQLREETSKLNAKQRGELFQRGMQIIYGGVAAKEKSGTGH